MAKDVEVRGVERLVARAEFMKETVDEALPGAVEAGAEVIREDAERRAPRRSEGPARDEHGAEHIEVVKKEEKDGMAAYGIGVTGEGFWLGIQEIGEGPSGRPQPWLRPALDTKKGEAKDEFEKRIIAAMEAALLG